jgi:tetrahydromethanopterin S-methyltransferase subunit C
MSTQFGTTLIVGAQTVTGYIIESAEIGDYEVKQADVIDATSGAIATRIVFTRFPILNMTMVTISGSTAISHFPKGLKAAHTGSYTAAGITFTFTSCIVDDCKVSESEGAQKVVVTLKNIGI